MVRLGIGGLLLVMALPAWAITADELRALAGVADQKERQRHQRLKTDRLIELVPEKRATPTPVVQPPSPSASPRIEKHASPPASVATSDVQKVKTAVVASQTSPPVVQKHGASVVATTTPNKPRTPGIYIPPPRMAPSSSLVTDAVEFTAVTFGIPLGTILSGELVRDVNNIEPGLIEIRLTAPVDGKRRVLPVNSRLFAEKRFNSASGRLELNVIKGITPETTEFSISGLVYDQQHISGLSGIISENKYAQATQSGVTRGMIAAGREAMTLMANQSIAGRVAGATSDSLIDTAEDALQTAQQSRHIVHVAAQSVLIRIEASF